MAMSFVDGKGETRFIERPCAKCARRGEPDKWHFDFACVSSQRAQAYIVEYANKFNENGETYVLETVDEIDPYMRTEAALSYDTASDNDESGKGLGEYA